ncbi:lipocalin family protein [Runella sp. SP2]|uniref:lipocalin family protein n=1 Tax=Runella sp. SP2 TaxID=2268026 RepID=UPI000F091F61|nr:lipocalin family protein [Runella sp. SP2]AYQ33023.1 hypothetical protein DTQ70_13050 [Runella sp. SP2]
MNTPLKSIAFGILFIASLISCTKEPSLPPKERFLSDKPWYVTGYTVQLGSRYEDRLSAMPNCLKDDIYVFTAKKQYEYNAGTTKCDPNDPQVIHTGIWSLSEDGNTLKINIKTGDTGLGLYEYKVTELSEHMLQLQFSDGGFVYRLLFEHP